MAEDIKFEKAMERLAVIVEELESGDIALEEILKKYEEGIRLSRICHERLTQAESKIELLTKQLDGQWKKQPFSSDAAESAKPKKTSRKNSSKSSDEDLEF